MVPPKFLSIELKPINAWFAPDVKSTFARVAAEVHKIARSIHQVGYTRFKIVLQNFYQTIYAPLGSSSGPIGDDAVDFEFGHQWRSINQLHSFARYLTKDLQNVSSKKDMFWFDLHAAMPEE